MAKYCSSCGNPIEDSCKICPNCGRNLKNDENQNKKKIMKLLLKLFHQ